MFGIQSCVHRNAFGVTCRDCKAVVAEHRIDTRSAVDKATLDFSLEPRKARRAGRSDEILLSAVPRRGMDQRNGETRCQPGPERHPIPMARRPSARHGLESDPGNSSDLVSKDILDRRLVHQQGQAARGA